MKARVITSSEFEIDRETYYIKVRHYDEELGYVTADWSRRSDGQKGELGYGIPSCDEAIRLAECAIMDRRRVENEISAHKNDYERRK